MKHLRSCLKEHQKKDPRFPGTVKEYSDLSSEICSAGMRGCTMEKFLTYFPDADDDFVERMDNFLRREGYVLKDEGVDVILKTSNQEVEPTQSAKEEPEQLTGAKAAAEWWASLGLDTSAFKTSLICTYFKEELCPPLKDKVEAENNIRKFNLYKLSIERHLAYAFKHQTPKSNNEWELMLSAQGLELAKLLQQCEKIRRSTALDHVKRVQRVVTLIIENWRAKPGFPVDKDGYISRAKDFSTELKSLIGHLQKAADKEKSQKKDAFVKSGGLRLGDIRSYFCKTDKVKLVVDELEKIEKFLKENQNIIPLGTGLQYNRVLGHCWNKVVRYLGMLMQTFSKRTSSLQGITLQEFEEREIKRDGHHVTIGRCKNRQNSSDGFIIPPDYVDLYERFYKVRLCCRKMTGEWDRQEYFINICGQKFVRFSDDINKEMPDQPHTINGRNIRTMISTAGQGMDASKRDSFNQFMNHQDTVDRRDYCCPNAEQCLDGQNIVDSIHITEAVREQVLPKIETLCSYSRTASFPSLLLCEDIIREMFKIPLKTLEESLYTELHNCWRRANLPKIAEEIASAAMQHNQGEFDAMFVLGLLREIEEWLPFRAEVRKEAEVIYNQMREVSIMLTNAVPL